MDVEEYVNERTEKDVTVSEYIDESIDEDHTVYRFHWFEDGDRYGYEFLHLHEQEFPTSLINIGIKEHIDNSNL